MLPNGILELDRFTDSSLDKWTRISADLDELNNVLHFHLEPERRRHRTQLLEALGAVEPMEFQLEGWARIVDYRWSLRPLSAAGSLTYVGGRFNVGRDLNPNTLDPWPALYIAQDHETAYREKYQLSLNGRVDGLTPEDLALSGGKSHTTVALNGRLHRVFDMRSAASLIAVAKQLARIQMPPRAKALRKKLKIKSNDLGMITSATRLLDAVAQQNWRVLPVQFGLPSPSQILAELIRAADFEAIAYRSTKGGATCLAIFPDCLAQDSFVALADPAPDGAIARLDGTTAEALSGWIDLAVKHKQ